MWLLILLLLSRAHALEGYEFHFAPVIGMSPTHSIYAGYDVAHFMPLTPLWQSKVRVTWTIGRQSTYTSNISAGLIFNFNRDLPRAPFFGAGVGFGNDCDFLISEKWNDGFGNTPYVYAEAGVRLQMTKSGSFSFAPTFALLASGRHHSGYVARLVNLAWNF